MKFVVVWLTMVVCAATVQSSSASVSLGLKQEIISERNGAFAIAAHDKVAPIWYDAKDYPGVTRAAGDLAADIERTTSMHPRSGSEKPQDDSVIIVGTLGKSELIDRLAAQGRLQVDDLRGKWESFVITTVSQPLPGIKKALVIAGSDKRGTIYGIYELSEQLGVSPWYWWADVPPKKLSSAFLKAGRFASGEPAVRYRGIFLNDEAPCLSGWTSEKFGGMNSQFYTKVFELLLRLRANYLWPAMWDNAFNEDDPANPKLADEYGIVMGTSHHEPMMRAHKEWTTRKSQYGNGQWNYATNAQALQRFFREGIARNKAYENIVTIGMRGDGDVGMASTGSMQSDIDLLQQIVADQRRILAEETHEAPERIPQLWALFTEVQKFYDNGMRVPDDVTLLFTDDNTGNLRRLPTAEERKRSGGTGIYYHFDMHGGPYAYQWINTNSFPKIWEQMNLAYRYDARRIWIVNVGDLKPLELPIEFFMRFAWNPEAMSKDDIQAYTRRWAERDFGLAHAEEIADIVAKYAKYNGWRKPEIVTPDTFSVGNYREAERVEAAWHELAKKADALYALLPAEQRDAYYQLVLHPTKASAVVNEMQISAGRSQYYAKQGRFSTNAEAARTRELFQEDQRLSDYYNHDLAAGKWNHLMDQPHLGQFTWEPPRVNALPPVSEILPVDNDNYAVSIEADVSAWPGHYGAAQLPVFDSLNPQRSYIEVFPEGTRPIEFSVDASDPWIVIEPDAASRQDRRFWISIDWKHAAVGKQTGTVRVKGKRGLVEVGVTAIKASEQQAAAAKGRYASLSGPISIAAARPSSNISVSSLQWQAIPDYGREAAGMEVFPVRAASILPPAPAPALGYDIYVGDPGSYEVTLVLGPVMDFVPDRGMRIAVGFDEDAPQVLDLFADREAQTFLGKYWWTQFTRDNVRYLRSSHVLTAGAHQLQIRMVDPGLVVEKIVISPRELPASYFGPPVQQAVAR